jgi:hypothetical protein
MSTGGSRADANVSQVCTHRVREQDRQYKFVTTFLRHTVWSVLVRNLQATRGGEVCSESREILGIMPQQASPLPEGPCLDTNAER